MKKFKTAVSMPCTMDQFKRDLEEKLEGMGYERGGSHPHDGLDKFPFICTGWADVSHKFEWYHNQKKRVFIPTYNPDLFLALAAMTEGDEPIAGEWVIAFIGETKYLARTSEVVKGDLKSDAWFVYGKSELISGSKDRGSFSRVERKATVEEIIAHFDGVEPPKPDEHEFKFGERVLCWDEDIESADEMYFVAKADTDYPYLAVNYLDELDDLKKGSFTDITPFRHCKPYPTTTAHPATQTKQITVTATYEGDEVKEVEVDGVTFKRG